MSKPSSKLRRVAIWIVALIAFVEVALQAAAYVAWTQRRAGETRSEGDGPVVLCVGDSMTYGLGSSPGESYPSQLERMLRERDGRAWVVVNGAYPGRNSRDVLHYLPSQLERFAPDWVFVLVGTNDWWSRPGEMRAPQDESFPIVWRTGRLIDILLTGRLAEHGEEGFVGTWNKDGEEVSFQPTGRMLYANQELRWETRGDKLIVVLPTQEEVEVTWRLDGDKLCLRSRMWTEEQVLDPGPVTDLSALQRGRRAAARGELAEAARELEASIASGRDVAAAREALVGVYLAQGDRDGATAQVGELARAAPSERAAGEALAHARVAIGEVDAAIDAAIALVGAHPESDRGWEILIKHGVGRGRTAEVVTAIENAVPALPEGHEWRAHLLVQRGLLLRDADPVRFLSSLWQALEAGALEKHIVNHVHLGRTLLTDDIVARAIAALGLDDADAARLRGLVKRGSESGGDVTGVIAGHIESIIDTCREAGAEPLLLDYPFRDLDHERLVDAIAAAKRVQRVPLRLKFDELLETMTRDDLFIRDDVHCNDAGYRVMAELAADALLR